MIYRRKKKLKHERVHNAATGRTIIDLFVRKKKSVPSGATCTLHMLTWFSHPTQKFNTSVDFGAIFADSTTYYGYALRRKSAICRPSTDVKCSQVGVLQDNNISF